MTCLSVTLFRHRSKTFPDAGKYSKPQLLHCDVTCRGHSQSMYMTDMPIIATCKFRFGVSTLGRSVPGPTADHCIIMTLPGHIACQENVSIHIYYHFHLRHISCCPPGPSPMVLHTFPSSHIVLCRNCLSDARALPCPLITTCHLHTFYFGCVVLYPMCR